MLTKRNNRQGDKFDLPNNTAWLLWGCQILNIACLVTELSAWMLALLALCLCWQALLLNNKKNNKIKVKKKHTIKGATQISPWLLMIFALSGSSAIAISASNLGVLASMVHLLAFAYVLKAFEIRRRKDFYQLLLLGLFLLTCALIFRQDLAFSLLVFLILNLNLTVLYQLFSKKKSLLPSLKTVSLLLAQSALLAITLFIIFPRLSPFWQVPSAQSATTGLSDEVSPGDIANLALSSDLAFRVDFKNNLVPPYSQLYWRAMTLENYDGRKWTRESFSQGKSTTKGAADHRGFSPSVSGNSIDYSVIAEPSFQSWLFALTVATTKDNNVQQQPDYTLQYKSPLNQATHYQVQSYLNTPLNLIVDAETKQRNLEIIKGSNPRLEALATKLKSQYIEPLQRAQAVLATFRQQKYYYTLQPPMLFNNSLDQFYFDTKAGFCVHYASSFTYLMRASGVPARVVTGYLGGEYNQSNKQGGHLNIYQYDAHAWSEIWLKGQGWYRIDPTSAVDPQRVESGWSTALFDQQSALNNDFIGLYRLKQFAWLNTIRLQLDELDYQWTRWVLGYSSKQQYDLLKRWFGKHMLWKTALMMAVSLIAMMLLVTVFNRLDFKRKKIKVLTPWLKIYQQTLTLVEKKGAVKKVTMTTSDFVLVVQQTLPLISVDFVVFTKAFQRLNYSELSPLETKMQLSILQTQYNVISNKLNKDNK